MKETNRTYYEIEICNGSNLDELNGGIFKLSESSSALDNFIQNIKTAKKLISELDGSLPYLVIHKIKTDQYGVYHTDYGNGSWLFDYDFESLPKYVKKKCRHLIRLARTQEQTTDPRFQMRFYP